MKTSHCHHRFLTTAFLLCPGLALAASPAARACDKYTHCKPCDCPCKCGCSGQVASADGVSRPDSQTSVAPVRYFNGDARIMADDFDSGAAAAPLWGHTRYYSNAFPNDNSFGNGNRWFVGQWPLLVQEGASIMVLFEPLRAYWFDPARYGGYTPRYGAKQTLVYDTSTVLRPFFATGLGCAVARRAVPRWFRRPKRARIKNDL